jgi:outer membrane receptor protein involved in Fe transport
MRAAGAAALYNIPAASGSRFYSAGQARHPWEHSIADCRDRRRIPFGGTPGYTVLDIRAGWKVCDGLDVWSAVENVTDRDYRIHGSGLNEPGTNFKCGAKWRF